MGKENKKPKNPQMQNEEIGNNNPMDNKERGVNRERIKLENLNSPDLSDLPWEEKPTKNIIGKIFKALVRFIKDIAMKMSPEYKYASRLMTKYSVEKMILEEKQKQENKEKQPDRQQEKARSKEQEKENEKSEKAQDKEQEKETEKDEKNFKENEKDNIIPEDIHPEENLYERFKENLSSLYKCMNERAEKGEPTDPIMSSDDKNRYYSIMPTLNELQIYEDIINNIPEHAKDSFDAICNEKGIAHMKSLLERCEAELKLFERSPQELNVLKEFMANHQDYLIRDTKTAEVHGLLNQEDVLKFIINNDIKRDSVLEYENAMCEALSKTNLIETVNKVIPEIYDENSAINFLKDSLMQESFVKNAVKALYVTEAFRFSENPEMQNARKNILYSFPILMNTEKWNPQELGAHDITYHNQAPESFNLANDFITFEVENNEKIHKFNVPVTDFSDPALLIAGLERRFHISHGNDLLVNYSMPDIDPAILVEMGRADTAEKIMNILDRETMSPENGLEYRMYLASIPHSENITRTVSINDIMPEVPEQPVPVYNEPEIQPLFDEPLPQQTPDPEFIEPEASEPEQTLDIPLQPGQEAIEPVYNPNETHESYEIPMDTETENAEHSDNESSLVNERNEYLENAEDLNEPSNDDTFTFDPDSLANQMTGNVFESGPNLDNDNEYSTAYSDGQIDFDESAEEITSMDSALSEDEEEIIEKLGYDPYDDDFDL